ncbi:hypothetical protein [Neobacillus drentensis]|uniref:hypothetical protein n=1 Tax=Neobacillus drentensis TaxID=220684 RepID=UPI002FFEEB42
MGKKGYLFVVFLLILVFFASGQMQKATPYEKYYLWYTNEIAIPIDQALKKTNDSNTIKDYRQARKTFLHAFEEASEYHLPDQKLDKTHEQLLGYLEWRIKYVDGFIEYLQTKSRDTKAVVNNYNDEGNIHYSIFISNFNGYAKESNHTFITPVYLY